MQLLYVLVWTLVCAYFSLFVNWVRNSSPFILISFFHFSLSYAVIYDCSGVVYGLLYCNLLSGYQLFVGWLLQVTHGACCSIMAV